MTLDDKTILITGSTDGVGRLLAQQMAAAGAHVLLHGRSAAKGEQALHEIREATGNTTLEYFLGDFASLDQVRALAAAIRQRHARIDILINNAGIGGGIRGQMHHETSADGYELRFAVNYLAPFLLTHLLLPVLIASAPSRIVNVASIGQYPIDFDNVMFDRDYDGFRAYRQSKLAQILFTFDLAARLAADGANVTVNALHPASLMNTKMVYESFGSTMTTIEDGAKAMMYLATSPDLDATTGQYFDQTRRARANDQAYNAEARSKLWDLSLRLTHLAPAPAEGAAAGARSDD
jgi:NAD(P)-dependent dehydrogenase (short-subunit alcohol dehydrogenase family)